MTVGRCFIDTNTRTGFCLPFCFCLLVLAGARVGLAGLLGPASDAVRSSQFAASVCIWLLAHGLKVFTSLQVALAASRVGALAEQLKPLRPCS